MGGVVWFCSLFSAVLSSSFSLSPFNVVCMCVRWRCCASLKCRVSSCFLRGWDSIMLFLGEVFLPVMLIILLLLFKLLDSHPAKDKLIVFLCRGGAKQIYSSLENLRNPREAIQTVVAFFDFTILRLLAFSGIFFFLLFCFPHLPFHFHSKHNSHPWSRFDLCYFFFSSFFFLFCFYGLPHYFLFFFLAC